MIREVTDQDAGAIAQIYNHYITNTLVTFEEKEIGSGDILERIQRVRDCGLFWYVAEEDGELIGYAYASKWKDRGAYQFTAEVSVYLSHTVTSKGWGTKLYEVLFESLRKKGIHSVIGGVAVPNPASIALHEKFGMKQVAHFKETGYKFGQWMDVVYLQTHL